MKSNINMHEEFHSVFQSMQVCETGSIPNTLSVADIAAGSFRQAEVLRKYGIDICCASRLNLEEASRKAGISEGELRSALQLSVLQPNDIERNYASWDPCFLVDHIVNVHHRYIRESAPVLLQFVRNVTHHHFKHHHELLQLETFLRHSLEDMITQMDQQEIILFPAIRHLAEAAQSFDPAQPVDPADRPSSSSMQQALAKMRQEHLAAEDDIRLFRTLTHDYQLPSGACNSYKYLFDKLQEFEADFHLHVRLEKDILFAMVQSLLLFKG